MTLRALCARRSRKTHMRSLIAHLIEVLAKRFINRSKRAADRSKAWSARAIALRRWGRSIREVAAGEGS